MSFFSRIIFVLYFAVSGCFCFGSSLPLPSAQNSEALARYLAGPQFEQLRQQLFPLMTRTALYAARAYSQAAPVQPTADLSAGTSTLTSIFERLTSFFSGGFALVKGASWIASFFGKKENIAVAGTAAAGALVLWRLGALELRTRQLAQQIGENTTATETNTQAVRTLGSIVAGQTIAITDNTAATQENTQALNALGNTVGQLGERVTAHTDAIAANTAATAANTGALGQVQGALQTNTQTLASQGAQLEELQTSVNTTVSVLDAHTTALRRLQEDLTAQSQTLGQMNDTQIQQAHSLWRIDRGQCIQDETLEQLLARLGTMNESLTGVGNRVQENYGALSAQITAHRTETQESSSRLEGKIDRVLQYAERIQSSSSHHSPSDSYERDDAQPKSSLGLLLRKQAGPHFGLRTSHVTGLFPLSVQSPSDSQIYGGFKHGSSAFPKSPSDSQLRIGHLGQNLN